MTNMTPRFEIMDPVVLVLDSEFGTGSDFHLDQLVEEVNNAGWDFSRQQIYRAVYYLHRVYGLVYGFGAGHAYRGLTGNWYRWNGSAERYEELRAAEGNGIRWVLDEPWREGEAPRG